MTTDYGEAFSHAVAAELRAERARTQITVASIVEATAISKTALLSYLNGKRDIPTRAFVDICRAIAISPAVIFDRAEEAMKLEGR